MARISEYSPALEPLTGAEVIVLNQNGVTHNTTVSALASSLPFQEYFGGKENYLGNPQNDGDVLASTTSGVRYWRTVTDPQEYFSDVFSYTTYLSVGDLVYQTGYGKEVAKAVDNNSPNPIIGIVTEVISSTEVEVSLAGKFTTSGILVEGKKVYVNNTGDVTSSLPGDNYIQVIGQALTANNFYLNPSNVRVKRS